MSVSKFTSLAEKRSEIVKIRNLIGRCGSGAPEPRSMVGFVLGVCVAFIGFRLVSSIGNGLNKFFDPSISALPFIAFLAVGFVVLKLFVRYSRWPDLFQDRLAKAIAAYEPIDLEAYNHLKEITQKHGFIPYDEAMIWADNELCSLDDLSPRKLRPAVAEFVKGSQ